jgi:hypothetical protein
MSGPFHVQIRDNDAQQSAAAATTLTKSLPSPAHAHYICYNPLCTQLLQSVHLLMMPTVADCPDVTARCVKHGRTDRKVRANNSTHFCISHGLRSPAQRPGASDNAKVFYCTI